MGYSHLGDNVFSVDSIEDVQSAYGDWIENEMEGHDNDGIELSVSTIPQDGYPMNLGFYRDYSDGWNVVDICKREPSDDEIHQLWAQSGNQHRN